MVADDVEAAVPNEGEMVVEGEGVGSWRMEAA